MQDPPSYFTHEQGFLVHDDPVPQALLDAARAVTRDFSLQVQIKTVFDVEPWSGCRPTPACWPGLQP